MLWIEWPLDQTQFLGYKKADYLIFLDMYLYPRTKYENDLY